MTGDLIKHRPALSGVLIWAVCVLIGAGVLVVAVSYAKSSSDQSAANLARALALKQYQGSIRACERGNVLRSSINTQIIQTQREFLATAASTRRSSALASDTNLQRRTDNEAAERYEKLLRESRLLPLIDCDKAYAKP